MRKLCRKPEALRHFSAKGRNYARITPRGSWLGGWLLGRHSWMLDIEGGQ